MRKKYEKKEAVLIEKFEKKVKRQYKELKSINFNCKSRQFMNCEFIIDKIHYRLEAIVLGKNGRPLNLYWKILQGRSTINYQEKDAKMHYGILLYKHELKQFKESLRVSFIDWKIFGRSTNAKVIWIYDKELRIIQHFDWELLFALF